MKAKLYCKNGFTFIEVMMVVVLMSMIVGITTIYFANSLPTAKLKASARDLAATIRYAKQLAYAKSEKQVLNIDLEAKSFAIKGRETKKIDADTAIRIYETDITAIPIVNGKYSITYDATGGSAWEAITLSRGERIVKIIVDPLLTAVVVDGKKDESDKK